MCKMNFKLTNDWDDIKEIVIYGFGRVCERIYPKLKRDFTIKYIIDNNAKLTDYEGVKIYKIEDVSEDVLNHKIIVTTSQNAFEDIRDDLEKLNAKEYQHFCKAEDFMIEWYWKNKHEICIPQLTTSLTSRCTFNCKKCATLMPYFKEAYDYTVKDVLSDLKLLFQYVDYIAGYYLVGGEPLLNPMLADVISEIFEQYGEKIGALQIISNGTIVPNEKLISVLKKYNIQMRISNYTKVIDYEKKFNQVIEVLNQNEIDYSIGEYEYWVDLGFPDGNVDLGEDIETLNVHMKACSTGCHALNDGKLYYCGTLFYAEKSKLFDLKEDDYVTLKISENVNDESMLLKEKNNIIKYCLGDRKDTFLSLCRYCRGFGKDNAYTCAIAEQVKR